MSILQYIAGEVASTAISVLTTTLMGGIAWLATLRYRSNKIRKLTSVPGRQFVFYFRGDAHPDMNKRLTFNSDGTIGLGRNDNEFEWKVRLGKLEILNSRKVVYSRFRWNAELGKLVHVNDPALPSVMGQYMSPLFIKPELPDI